MLDRTARGRADAKAKGVKFGRKPTLTPHQQKEAIRRRDVDGETLRSIARSYNVSPQTISRLASVSAGSLAPQPHRHRKGGLHGGKTYDYNLPR
jgi:DNA invertase Pin-like site-specific DNA recombinase